MAELSKRTAAPAHDVLPGFQLSPLRASDFGSMEDEFEARHLARTQVLCESLPPVRADALMKQVLDELAAGKFGYGGAMFDRAMLQSRVAPRILWLELRRNHSEVTLVQCEEWLDGPDADKLLSRVYALAGYPSTPMSTKKNGQATARSSGASSSKRSGKKAAQRRSAT